MEQLTFEIEKSDTERIIDDIFHTYSEYSGFDINLFDRTANINKGNLIGYSITLNKALIAKVNSELTEISTNKKIIDILGVTDDASLKPLANPIGFVKYKCERPENGKILLEHVMQTFIDTYIPSERFGCCHRYVECSDAKACTAPDKFHARGCYYRENLEKGKIFYGKNAK